MNSYLWPKNYDNKIIGSEANEEEVVVDMEGEVISALEEIDRLRIKNKKKKTIANTVRKRQ